MGREAKPEWMETGYLKMKDIEAIPLDQRLNILDHYQSGEYDPITDMAQAQIGVGEAEVIENLGFATSLVFLILSVILSLIILICGFFIIYTVYFRFLKIMVIVPLAAVAFSTLAGNRTVSVTCVRYFKYFLSVVMEAVTMALAILIRNAFISVGLPSFTGGYADWAQSLTGRALGL